MLLYWYLRGKMSPRSPGFPSWSQLGWCGSLDWDHMGFWPHIPCDLGASIEVIDDSTSYSLDTLLQLPGSSFRVIVARMSRRLKVTAWTLELPVKHLV